MPEFQYTPMSSHTPSDTTALIVFLATLIVVATWAIGVSICAKSGAESSEDDIIRQYYDDGAHGPGND